MAPQGSVKNKRLLNLYLSQNKCVNTVGDKNHTMEESGCKIINLKAEKIQSPSDSSHENVS
jgi:hypothetical protein